MDARRAVLCVGLAAVLIAAVAGSLAWPADWPDSRKSGPFTIRADFPLGEYDGLFGELDHLQTDLDRTLGVGMAREPVELYLFQSESSYREYLRLRLPQVPFRRALYVKGNGPGRIYAYRSRELPIDVRHECTHGLLHAVLPLVPLWLDEGLAEYFEVSEDHRAFGNAHLKWTRIDARLGRIPPLARLEAKRDIGELSSTDYRHCWAYVHFMLHGPPEAREELVRILSEIKNRTPPGRLSERLERRLPGIDKHLALHFKNWKR